jgi:ubiquinone/menaquinone biosynthesis C-methylase UbiE
MPFGYLPDFAQDRSIGGTMRDLYLRVLGYPGLVRRLEARLVFKFLGDLPGKRVLDLGCGSALFDIELARRGASVAGLDLSEPALELGRWRIDKMGLASEAVLHLCDASRTIPFANDSFDAVLSNCVLEHIADDSAAIKEAARVLKPGRPFVATVPLDYATSVSYPRLVSLLVRLPPSLKKRLGSLPVRQATTIKEFSELSIIPYNHARFGYTQEEICAKLERAGLQVMRTEHYMKFFATIPSDMLEGLALFEVEKGGQFEYAPRHAWAIAATFPPFYAAALLDALLPRQAPAKAIAVLAQKIHR